MWMLMENHKRALIKKKKNSKHGKLFIISLLGQLEMKRLPDQLEDYTFKNKIMIWWKEQNK